MSNTITLHSLGFEKKTDLIFSILAHVKFWIPLILGLSLCKFEWVY